MAHKTHFRSSTDSCYYNWFIQECELKGRRRSDIWNQFSVQMAQSIGYTIFTVEDIMFILIRLSYHVIPIAINALLDFITHTICKTYDIHFYVYIYTYIESAYALLYLQK